MQGFKDLKAYQLAFELAMKVFILTKSFPKEEIYSLTDQVRRSSRSVCANIGEGYRKRLYPKHFVSKLSDADAECSETQVWLDFALACGYLSSGEYDFLYAQYEEVGKLLGYMMKYPEKFGAK
jgi:four helix bundle protein